MSGFKLHLLALSLSCFFVQLICTATVVILEPGEDGTLLCNNPSVIWNVTYLNSNLNSTLTPSFPSGSLRIESFERDRAGLYRCVARGTVAVSYWVVSSADLFEPFSPNRLMVTEGQQIISVIRTRPFLIDPSNFQEILVYKNGTRIQRLRASNGTASFIVEMAELVDSGNYTFVIHTDTDHESDILEIQVEPLLLSVAPSTSLTPMSIVPTTASMCECSGGRPREFPSSLLSHELYFLNDENVAIPQPSSHIVVVTEVSTTTEYVTPSSTTCPTPEATTCSGHIGGIIVLSLLVGGLLIVIAVLIYYFLHVRGRRKYNTSDTPEVDTMEGDNGTFESPSGISQNEDNSPLILHPQVDMADNSQCSSRPSTPQGPQPFGPDTYSIGPHSSHISLSTNSSSSPRPGKVSVRPKMETIGAYKSTTIELVTKGIY